MSVYYMQDTLFINIHNTKKWMDVAHVPRGTEKSGECKCGYKGWWGQPSAMLCVYFRHTNVELLVSIIGLCKCYLVYKTLRCSYDFHICFQIPWNFLYMRQYKRRNYPTETDTLESFGWFLTNSFLLMNHSEMWPIYCFIHVYWFSSDSH